MTDPVRTIPCAMLLDGQDRSRVEVLILARAHLVSAGWHELDADDALSPRPGLVVRAWWGGDERGFVQQHHDDATAVTVVNVDPGSAA